jgi:hypothetical protein
MSLINYREGTAEAKGRREIKNMLADLTNKYCLPPITEWKQGKFIDSPKYDRMGEDWKNEQIIREKHLIRPNGGTNNALFSVDCYFPDKITAYLEDLGDHLASLEKE